MPRPCVPPIGCAPTSRSLLVASVGVRPGSPTSRSLRCASDPELVVGSPTIRVAAIAVAVAVLLTLGGAALGGLVAAASQTLPRGARRYLTKFCDLASLDEVRTILGDDSAATVAHGLGRSKHTGLQSCVWRSEVPHERFLGVRDWTPSMYETQRCSQRSYRPGRNAHAAGGSR